jgi:hypothetical protein
LLVFLNVNNLSLLLCEKGRGIRRAIGGFDGYVDSTPRDREFDQGAECRAWRLFSFLRPVKPPSSLIVPKIVIELELELELGLKFFQVKRACVVKRLAPFVLDCAACSDVSAANDSLPHDRVVPRKEMLGSIAAM